MRKLMWFTIGFALACGLCVYTLPNAPIIPAMAIAALLFAVTWITSQTWKWLRRIALTAIGMMMSLWLFLGFQLLYAEPIQMVDGGTYSVTLTASDHSYATDYGIGVDCTARIAGRTVKLRAYLDGSEAVQPGDTLSGNFRLRMTTPGGEKESAYHSGSGTFLLAYQSGQITRQEGDSGDLRYFPIYLREQIRSILRACFPEDVFPFVQALLLGDSSGISYELDTAFSISGIRHIIAVSGLHVSVFYGLISLITFRRRFLTAVICLPVLFLFAAVAGFTPSVTRACIMISLMVLAQVFNREYDPPTALSFACLVMLAVNPFVISSVSFQLSVGCVAGILLFSTRIHDWLLNRLCSKKRKSLLARLVQAVCLSVSVTLGAMSLTTPLCAYYFGVISLIGIVGNLVTLWAVNLLFTGIVITVLLSLLSGGAGAFAGGVLAWLARYVCGTAQLLSRVPLAAVYTQSIYIVVWLVFVYILLAVFLLQQRKRPGMLICCAVLGLCVSLLASWLEPVTSDTRLTVLDVGQGQSILLQSGGSAVLVDCGGDSDEETADLVAGTLLSQGVTRLDAVILTHCDRDHAGGAQYLFTRIPADILMIPANADPETAQLLSRSSNHRTVYIDQNMLLTVGENQITVFAPTFVKDSNENSLCVLYQSDNCSILITGDRSEVGERLLMKENDLPDVDVLIAGHHGSKYSTSQELLDTVRPETVIISVGERNYYGHPAQELLERLMLFGCEIFRTDLHGTVIYRH